MSYETLEIERDGAVGRVWMNRPNSLNALNTTILEELADAFVALQRDHDLRVVVLGGRGRAFSAGADRNEGSLAERLEQHRNGRARRYAGQVGRRAMQAITELEATTIARVQGHAVGGGFCLALGCDFRIAAAGTRFHIPEVDLGVPLTWSAAPRLIYEVGPFRAREWITMCDVIPAEEALAAGVLNRVVPESELDAEVGRWTERLLAKSDVALHMTKTQFRGYARMAVLGDATETDGDLIGAASTSDEARKAFNWKS